MSPFPFNKAVWPHECRHQQHRMETMLTHLVEEGSKVLHKAIYGQMHRIRSIATASQVVEEMGVNCIPTTHGRVTMATSTHCGCGAFGGCGGSCSASGRALVCACPPSTLQGKRNTSTHSSWTQPPLD